MRSNFLLAGLLLTGCIDVAADDADKVPASDDDLDLRTGNPVVQHDDTFGDVMVVGDFNGDGWMDLAVSATGETVDNKVNAGAVMIFFGTSTGLKTGHPSQTFTVLDFGGTPHDNDRFGMALAAGDMTGDGVYELAIGAPGFWAAGVQGAGAVFTMKGVKGSGTKPYLNGGLATGTIATEANAGGSVELNDGFGSGLAMGKYDGSHAMVAAGASGEKPGTGLQTGWATVMFWNTGMPSLWKTAPAPSGISGAGYGTTLQTIHYSTGADDLAVAAPYDTGGGTVHIFKGGSTSLSHIQTLGGAFGSAGGFGLAMATGAFHQTAKPELAIGLPLATGNPPFFAGQVVTYLSTASHTLSQNDLLSGSGILPMQFGRALAAADLNNDGLSELAVGAPNFVGSGHQGEVLFFSGGATPPMPPLVNSPVTMNVESYATGGSEGFGSSIALGDFDHNTANNFADAAIGAPHANVSGIVNAGLFDELRGVGSGSAPIYIRTHTEAQ